MTRGREILIGVSGGIAAYKAAGLVSQLVQGGQSVSVVMTSAAEQFVGPATFAALSGRPVASVMWDPGRYPLGPHIELAEQADLLCVVPATANFLSKAATGLADDLLSTLYLCFRGPVIMAPAMNWQMWEQPSVQRNVTRLVEDGVTMVGPREGWLSCRQQGVGRLADPDEIRHAIEETLGRLPGTNRGR
ncbi:MAG: phosphopantothenoylcysteine decarboxylase [Planctomycetales bacterium]|nr:phosphopantothenoylcysteine decarboxylase [Planctomycetales bacterium]